MVVWLLCGVKILPLAGGSGDRLGFLGQGEGGQGQDSDGAGTHFGELRDVFSRVCLCWRMRGRILDGMKRVVMDSGGGEMESMVEGGEMKEYGLKTREE